MIANAIENRTLFEQMIKIIVEDAIGRLPPEMHDKLLEKLSEAGVQFGGRMVGRAYLVGAITRLLASKIVAKFVAQRVVAAAPSATGIGICVTGALMYGMVERASNASKRLQKVNPRLFSALRGANLDLLYFMVEDEMAPFVTLDAVQLQRPAAFERWAEEMKDALE